VCKCVLPPGDNPIAVNKYYYYYIIIIIIKETTLYKLRPLCSLAKSYKTIYNTQGEPGGKFVNFRGYNIDK
jgi:hypothetical protein